MDFTIKSYKNLLTALQNQGFVFQTLAGFLENPADKAVILRHDVDARPQNSLAFAKIQAERNIRGTYYFRAVPQSWNESIIKEINDLGHEVGYHYESLTTCNGNLHHAYEDFKRNLENLRQLVPVQTICMHGSPRSPHDSKDLWKTYNYRDYGIIGEPYLDIDYSKVLYLTDTGRRWDGDRFSIRDRVSTTPRRTEPPVRAKNFSPPGTARTGEKFFAPTPPRYRSTPQIITAANQNRLPNQILFTFHPQRWTSKLLP